MQILQDWTTFRWSRITLLSDPGAKVIKLKFRVFPDSTSRFGVSNPDPSNKWATQLEDVWNEHGFAEKLSLAAREVQFIWHVLPGASFLDIKKHIQRYLTGKIQNPLLGGSYSCLCSTTLDRQRKAIEKLVGTMPKKWQHWRPTSSQYTGASWSPRPKISGGTHIPPNLKDNGILSHCRWLTHSSVILPTR